METEEARMVAFLTTLPLIEGVARSWQQFSCPSESRNNVDEGTATLTHDIQNVHAIDDLLSQRMGALGFDTTEVVQFWPDLIPNLHKTCVGCGSRTQCDADLKSVSPDGDGLDLQTWRDYCPNVATLKMLGSLLPAIR
jgi:hypothetical protein